MFYNTELLDEGNGPEKDIKLILHFLEESTKTTLKIAEELGDLTIEVRDELNIDLLKVIEFSFENLQIAKRDMRIESLLASKEVAKNLLNNGLTGKVLYAKLKVLDWLWEKAKSLFMELRGGLNVDLFNALINQLNSILKSILNALGIPTDIYDEAYDLLTSFVIMSNTKHH